MLTETLGAPALSVKPKTVCNSNMVVDPTSWKGQPVCLDNMFEIPTSDPPRVGNTDYAGSVDNGADERLYSVVATRLREARRRAEMSQDAVAAATGLKRSSIANFERGRHHLQLHKLYRYAQAVGVETAELFPSLTELADGDLGAKQRIQLGSETVEVPSHQAAFVREILGRGR